MLPRSSPGGETRPEADAELWQMLARDRPAALCGLYDRYAGLVYGLAIAILAHAQEAEDLTQEVFVSLCGACDYDPARGPLAAYLATVTRSRAIDRLRKRARRLRLLERHSVDLLPPDDRFAPLERISSGECAREVKNALAQLPELHRQVIEMAYYRGLSQTQIAAELGLPLGTVKGWMRRGLLALRKSLDPLVRRRDDDG